MSTQPKALRLADALDAEFVQGRISNSTGRESAVELRRLHEALETEQEPVAEIQAEDMGKPFNAIRVTVHFYAEVPAVGTKLYKAPPKREWVGLTAYEIQEIHSGNQHWGNFACAIEAKLKEKNHG